MANIADDIDRGCFEVEKVPLQCQVYNEQWTCKNGQQQLQRESGKDFCEVNSSNLINFLKLHCAWVWKLEVDWKKVLRLIFKSIFSTHKVLSESKKMQTWGERVFWEWILLLTTGSLLNVLLLQGTSCTCTCIYSFNRFPDKVLLGLQTLRRTNIKSGEEHEVNECKLHQRHNFDSSELMLDPPPAHCLTSRYTTGTLTLLP